MILSKEKPQIYETLHKIFGVEWDNGVIITYGDTVYCKFDLGWDKRVHEAVHVRQQKEMGAEAWWNRYLEDTEFRLSQELEAYKEEVKFLRQNIKDRNQLFRAIRQVSLDLSGSMYGNIISYGEAFKILNGR